MRAIKSFHRLYRIVSRRKSYDVQAHIAMLRKLRVLLTFLHVNVTALLFSSKKRLAALDRTISQDRAGQDVLSRANY